MDTNYIYDAAIAFKKLLDVEYHIVLGRKGTQSNIHLCFCSDNFFHLSGLHKLKDSYNFQRLPYNQIFKDILNKKITDETIKNDPMFEKIIQRMKILSQLESLLDDSNTLFFGYNLRQVTINSKINADYVIKGNLSDKSIILTFIILNRDDRKFYTKSIFAMDNYDYTRGQTQYTVLLKEKYHSKSQDSTQLYIHPGYKNSIEEADLNILRPY